MPRARWYEHVPPATGTIPCGDEDHHLTWKRGKVKLEDHDLGGERAMMVLGGEPCSCLKALRLWADQFGMPPDVFGQMQSWLGDDAPLAPSEIDLHRTLGMLLNWERAWKAGRYMTKHGGLIEKEVKAIALPVVRAHLNAARQAFGSKVVRSVAIRVVPAVRRVELRGQMDRISVTAEATLSTDWVLDVWAAGLATIDDALVLAAIDPPEGAPAGDSGLTAVAAARWISDSGRTATPAVGQALVRRSPGGEPELDWITEPAHR